MFSPFDGGDPIGRGLELSPEKVWRELGVAGTELDSVEQESTFMKGGGG